MSDSFNSLDDFFDSVASKDTSVRLDVYPRLEAYLQNEHNHMHCSDSGKFCEFILTWINCSNFKVSMNGLSIIQLLIQRFTENLRNYSTESNSFFFISFLNFHLKLYSYFLSSCCGHS